MDENKIENDTVEQVTEQVTEQAVETQPEQEAQPAEERARVTTFSAGALDKMISDLKDESSDVVPENFEFGEKKVDRKKLSVKVIKYILAGIFLVAFAVWGISMKIALAEYNVKLWEEMPLWIHIVVILGTLYSVSVIANFFGGEENKEQQAREET